MYCGPMRKVSACDDVGWVIQHLHDEREVNAVGIVIQAQPFAGQGLREHRHCDTTGVTKGLVGREVAYHGYRSDSCSKWDRVGPPRDFISFLRPREHSLLLQLTA